MNSLFHVKFNISRALSGSGFILGLILFCFLSYGNTKFVLLGLLIFYLLLLLTRREINRFSLIIWMILTCAISLAAVVGAIRNNDAERIFYDQYTVLFALLGMLVAGNARSISEVSALLNVVAKYYAAVCFVVVFIYLCLLLLYGVDGFLIVQTYFERFQLSFNLAGGGKVVTDNTPLILLILPYVIMRRQIMLAIPIILMILLSVSVTQYFCLLLTTMVIGVRWGVRQFSAISIGFAATLLVIVFAVPSLSSDFQSKYANFSMQNDDASTSGLLSRIVQAEIMLEEFYSAPIIGKGLGYKSEKYNSVRSQWGDVPDRNLSMYENQYLDILMKFGGLLALLTLSTYIVIPMVYIFVALRRKAKEATCVDRQYFKEITISIAIGFMNLIIYVGSNGNQWYSPISMFSWGLVFVLMQKMSSKEFKRRAQTSNATTLLM